MNINKHTVYMLPSIDIAVVFGTTRDEANAKTYYELKGIYLPADNHVACIGDIAVKTYFSTCVMPLMTGKMTMDLFRQTARSLNKLITRYDFFSDMYNADVNVNSKFTTHAGINHFGKKVDQNDFKKIAAKLALYFMFSFIRTDDGSHRSSFYYDGCAYVREFDTYNEAMAHMQKCLIDEKNQED